MITAAGSIFISYFTIYGSIFSSTFFTSTTFSSTFTSYFYGSDPIFFLSSSFLLNSSSSSCIFFILSLSSYSLISIAFFSISSSSSYSRFFCYSIYFDISIAYLSSSSFSMYLHFNLTNGIQDLLFLFLRCRSSFTRISWSSVCLPFQHLHRLIIQLLVPFHHQLLECLKTIYCYDLIYYSLMDWISMSFLTCFHELIIGNTQFTH